MKNFVKKLRWFYATRVVGLSIVIYEVVLDKGSADRGTIIIAACGLAGYELVAKRGSSE
jgi:hypothetical protein